jgi:hypothetical protein
MSKAITIVIKNKYHENKSCLTYFLIIKHGSEDRPLKEYA